MKTIASLVLGSAWLLTTATSVSAECTGPTDPWPSFRAAVPTAERIIAGEVLPPVSANDSTGYRAVFTIRVIDVLRGPAPAQPFVEIVGLRSGLPLTVCASSTATLLSGDMVVFALGAIATDGVTRINTLAYLREPAESILTGVERITAAELDAITRPPVPAQDEPAIGGLIELVVGFVIVGLGAALRHRRSIRGTS